MSRRTIEVFFPSYHLHDLIKARADHFLDRAVLALTDAGNAVPDRKLAGQLRGPPGTSSRIVV
jgi:hypothetical protein